MYEKSTWQSGDIISAAKANNWETQFDQSVKYSEINRQTVIEGATSTTDGTANFITGSTTALTAFATASTGEPIIISFAAGNSTLGGLNYDAKLTTDASWTGLTANNTNYLFFETSTAYSVTSSQTIVPPQYGYFFDTTSNVLLHFDGTGGSTQTTDNFGNTWTNFGTAALSTAQFQFGTASLTLPGSGASYVQTSDITNLGDDGWTQEGWFYINSTAGSRTVVASVNDFGFRLMYNNVSGHMNIWLAGSTSAHSIANQSSGTTTINVNTWYSWAMTYNSSTYRLWINGTSEISVASTVLVNYVLGGIRQGVDNAGAAPFSGFIDEYRLARGVSRYNATYTPSTAAFTGDVHFYDINKAKMYFGDPTSWTEKIRVFAGEAVTDAATVTNSVTYALKGTYESTWFTVTAVTDHTKNHKIGVQQPELQTFRAVRFDGSGASVDVPCTTVEIAGLNYGGNVNNLHHRNTAIVHATAIPYHIQDTTSSTQAQYKVKLKRHF